METPRGQAGVAVLDRLTQGVPERSSAKTMRLCLGGAASANGSAAQAEPPRLATGLARKESDPKNGCAVDLGRAPTRLPRPRLRFAFVLEERA